MSVFYCQECERIIDLDLEVEHPELHEEQTTVEMEWLANRKVKAMMEWMKAN